MKQRLLNFVRQFLCLTLSLALVLNLGCAPVSTPLEEPPAQDIFCKRIVIVAKNIEPQLTIEGIPHSKSSGAGRWAGKTLTGCASPALEVGARGGGNALVAALMFLVMIPWLGVCAVASLFAGIGGAFVAPSADTMAETEGALKQELTAEKVQDYFRSRVTATAREQGIKVVDVDQTMIPADDDTIDHDYFQKQGVDTILEVAISRIDISGKGTSLEKTPVKLTMYAQTRAIIIEDQKPLPPREFIYSGNTYTVDKWQQENYQRLREDLSSGIDHISELIFFNFVRPASSM